MKSDRTEKLRRKLVMTLLTRDEEDIVDQVIQFHLNQGVDYIIATDNGSVDGTREILVKYEKAGVLHLIDDPVHVHNQDKRVHRMVQIARDQYAADWIVNVDADEFWYCNHGNLKLALPEPEEANIVFVGSIQSDPVEDEPFRFSVPRHVSGKIYDCFKCLHTAKDFEGIVVGNHNAQMANRRSVKTQDIIIFHFSIRSYAHYERKVVNTVEAMMRNPALDTGIGYHIRESYARYVKGELRQEYEEMKTRDQGLPNYIRRDSRLHDYIHNQFRSIESLVGPGFCDPTPALPVKRWYDFLKRSSQPGRRK